MSIINTNTNTKTHYILSTKSLLLRPYCRKYVQQYHSWFVNDQQLLYLTGSQLLTYQQELENHHSWLTDNKKYTFLVFTKQSQQQQQNKQKYENQEQQKNNNTNNNNNNNTNKLIGDVNLFFSDWIEPNQAEINIMLAVKQHRGKGYAKQIMQVIQKFVLGVYKKDEIIAKIKDDNKPSIRFFQKIGYQFINHNVNHQQVQYRKRLLLKEEGDKLQQKAMQLLQQLKNVYNMRVESNVQELFGVQK